MSNIISKLSFHWSMAWVFTAGMAAVIVLMMTLITLVDIRRERSISRENLEQRGLSLAGTLGDVLVDPLYFIDVDLVDDLVTTVVESQPDLEYIQVFRPDGSVLVDTRQSDYPSGELPKGLAETLAAGGQPQLRYMDHDLVVSAALMAGEQAVGIVHFAFSTGSLRDEINVIMFEHIWQGLVLVGVSVALSFLVARYATRPLRTLSSAASDMGGGNLDLPVPAKGPKEVRQLGVSLEWMRGELRGLYSNLEDQVDQRTEELTRTTRGLENEIIERKLAEEDLWQRNQELETLINVADIMARENTFQNKCDAIMEKLVQVVSADLATLRVLDSTGESLELEAAAGEHRFDRPAALPLSQGLTALALSKQELLVVNEYDLHPRADPHAVAQGFKSGVFLPIMNGGDKILGVIDVVSTERDHFTPQRVKLLTAIVDGLGALLNSASLSQELQANVEELALVDEVSRIITSTLDIDYVYEQFAAEVKKLVAFDRIAVHIIDQDAGTSELKYVSGVSTPKTRAGAIRRLENTRARDLIATGKTIVVRDLRTAPAFELDQEYIGVGLISSMVVPLVSNALVVGGLTLRSRHVGAYGPNEQSIVERLANQIAPAVENSLLFDQVQQTAQALEAIGDAVIFSDLEGHIRFTNHAFEDMFGYAANEVLGHPVGEIIHGVKSSWDLGLESVQTPVVEAWRGETIQSRKNGEEFHVNLTVTPVKGAAGNAIGVIVVAQDISPRIVAEEERMAMELRALAQSKLATLGEVATGVAHEINQPLTYINTMIQAFQEDLALNDLDQERMAHRLSESRRQVDRITNIVEHLRIFGRSDNSEMEPLNLEEILDNTMLLLKERLMARNIDLSLRVDPGLPRVIGNASQLEQVFINLLQNSLDALAERRGDAQISVTLSPANGGAAADVVFYDNGVGISPDILPKIYDPFFTTKGVGQGTGLGLAIAYGIVRDHHGSITCESEPGQGTTVTITLPGEGVHDVNS